MGDALPRALLVDLDDTVLAFDVVSREAWKAVCCRFAPWLRAEATVLLQAVLRCRAAFWSDSKRRRWGRLNLDRARSTILSDALAEIGAESSECVRTLAREMGAAYDRQRIEAMYPLPGAVETLQELRERGVRLALLTNGAGPSQRAKIDRFRLEPLFDCIVIEGEFGAGKPDEPVYRHALTQLGATPQEAWMVGDDLELDVAGAQRLGIFGIWIDTHGKGLPADSPIRPNRMVRALAGLLET